MIPCFDAHCDTITAVLERGGSLLRNAYQLDLERLSKYAPAAQVFAVWGGRYEEKAALLKAETTGGPAGAMVLPDGRVVTGKTSDTLGAASALLLNALKAVGGIDDQFELISAQVLEPVCRLKTEYLGHKNPRLHTDEVLMALTISALTNPLAELAQQQLPKLRGCDAHFTVILSEVDENLLKRLGINVSCEARYETKKLYHK